MLGYEPGVLAGAHHQRQLDDAMMPEAFGDQNQLIRQWTDGEREWNLEVFYEEATSTNNERLKMVVDMPNNTWLSIGFGSSMRNVDMIAWHANGDNSYVADYFSVGKSRPALDSEQNLTATFQIEEKDDIEDEDQDRVKFVTYRDLETNDTEFDYIVPLDQEIDMVYAFLSFSADWREHNKKGNWSMKVHKGLGNDIDND